MPRLVLISLYSSIDGNRIVATVCCALVINCSFIIEHILIFSSILYPFIMPRWKNTYESGLSIIKPGKSRIHGSNVLMTVELDMGTV